MAESHVTPTRRFGSRRRGQSRPDGTKSSEFITSIRDLEVWYDVPDGSRSRTFSNATIRKDRDFCDSCPANEDAGDDVALITLPFSWSYARASNANKMQIWLDYIPAGQRLHIYGWGVNAMNG